MGLNLDQVSSGRKILRGVAQAFVYGDLVGTLSPFNVTVDDDRISIDSLERITNAAGRFEGLGTWRPRFGRFQSVLNEVEMD